MSNSYPEKYAKNRRQAMIAAAVAKKEKEKGKGVLEKIIAQAVTKKHPK